jgi:hypothetical protein
MPTMTFTDVKTACDIAYHGVKGDTFEADDKQKWQVTEHWATRFSGFKAVLLQRTNLVVLAFAGTDSVRDGIADLAQVVGILPIQYAQALALTNERKALSRNLQLAGHSLGGGLAAYCSVATKLPAGTVNPAPLVAAASLSALFGNNNQIVNYISGGSEFVSSSPGRNPGRTVNVPGNGNFFTRHMLGNTGPQVDLPKKV